METIQQQKRKAGIDEVVRNLHGIYAEDWFNALVHVLKVMGDREFKAMDATIQREHDLIEYDRKHSLKPKAQEVHA